MQLKVVDASTEMVSDVVDKVKTETSNAVENTQKFVSDTAEGIKAQTVELLDGSTTKAENTTEPAKETLALSPVDENEILPEN